MSQHYETLGWNSAKRNWFSMNFRMGSAAAAGWERERVCVCERERDGEWERVRKRKYIKFITSKVALTNYSNSENLGQLSILFIQNFLRIHKKKVIVLKYF